MKHFKGYVKEFISDESGMEFLQVAVLVTLVALLIVAIIFLFDIIKDKIYEAGDEASEINENFNPGRGASPARGGGGTGGADGGT